MISTGIRSLAVDYNPAANALRRAAVKSRTRSKAKPLRTYLVAHIRLLAQQLWVLAMAHQRCVVL